MEKLTRDEIRAIALENGFTLKDQPDGSKDLHPYVYRFAERLLDKCVYKRFNLNSEFKKAQAAWKTVEELPEEDRIVWVCMETDEGFCFAQTLFSRELSKKYQNIENHIGKAKNKESEFFQVAYELGATVTHWQSLTLASFLVFPVVDVIDEDEEWNRPLP